VTRAAAPLAVALACGVWALERSRRGSANGPCTIRIYAVLDGRRHVITGEATYLGWNP
jgi:hypothetical protein